MRTEALTCSRCGAPLVPGQVTSVPCGHCGQLNYIRPVDALGPMASVDLKVEGANVRFTDSLMVTTSAPACLAITSMLGSSITGSITISLTSGDLSGRVFDMRPENRTANDFVINLIDMTAPTTYTNMVTSPSVFLGDEGPDVGGEIHVDHFDLSTGRAKLELVGVRLAKLMTKAVCTVDGTIETFRSANPLVAV